MIRHLSSALAPLAAGLWLTACEPVSMVATGASIVSVLQSEETLGDKALSWATDQDCSIFHAARGQAYCQPVGPVMPEQYCYRNLGGITCYTQPDVFASSETEIYAKADPALPAAEGPGDHMPTKAPAMADSSEPNNPAH